MLKADAYVYGLHAYSVDYGCIHVAISARMSTFVSCIIRNSPNAYV